MNGEQIWFKDYRQLLSDQIIPIPDTTINSQLNCLSRLFMIIFIIIFIFNTKYALAFGVISIVFIIIIYLVKKKDMKENYVEYKVSPDILSSNNKPIDIRSFAKKEKSGVIEIPMTDFIPFANDTIDVDPLSKKFVSLNQSLAGGANPNTKIQPVIVPKLADLDYWKQNNLVTLSTINSQGAQEDMYLSGYAVDTCCGVLNGCLTEKSKLKRTPTMVEGYANYPNRECPIRVPKPVVEIPRIPRVVESYENTGYAYPDKECPIRVPKPVVEIPRIPYVEKYENKEDYYVKPNQPGWINTSCGYNPRQLIESGVPSNLPVGNCQQSASLKRFNENLFTSTVTPGVYMRTQVNEPINSNIGISFTQQFEPVGVEESEKGILYTQYDPRLTEEEPVVNNRIQEPNYDNVYDPRFYGYGTSYRTYYEPVTGQTRFMYDDINAIRMPNYITRNKIDHLSCGDTYGPMKPGSEFGNVDTSNIRDMANASWLANSLQFRNDMTEKLMRKTNAESWQKRAMPLGPHMV